MKAFFAEEQKRHDPKAFLSSGAPQPNPEQPERAERLLAGAKSAGLTIERPRDHGLGPVAAVHTPEYLDFLEHIFARWQRIEGASAEVIPNIHPIARDGVLSGLGGRPGRLPHGRHRLPDLGRDLAERAVERLERGRGSRNRHGGRACRLCTLPPARPPCLCRCRRRLLLHQQFRRRGASVCASRRRAWRSSMSTCITATARKAFFMRGPTC